jgi:CheY-like chemotaxis protein
MDRPVVVLIEDHADTLELYARLLESRGYDVRPLDTGEGAVELIRRVSPAAVVLDVGLPGRDGMEICRLLRQLPRFASLPIIAVSAWIGTGFRGRSIEEANFSELLPKPVHPGHLLAAVQRWAPIDPVVSA